ncbi:MAG: 50S ribosomal protein L11 methyltransferase [Chitinophagaceae bacterium]|nr:50S ribosomal protein L11 methyltransferase [Chitinophagaceae bacterium]
MSKYVQIEFVAVSTEQKNILIATLAASGFEGFEENDTALKAFIPENVCSISLVNEIADRLQVSFNKTVIEETNWNEVWESNFDPVIVDDFVAVRAEFHEPAKGVEHEIVITPKMSFGTGHHATTHMMVQQMRLIDFRNKTVFDFGTGTGVLAILAEKLGAKEVLAIDIDEWSIENANENIRRNHCSRISLQKAASVNVDNSFDVILANINKNVILDNFSTMVNSLNPGGILLLSGLLPEDKDDIFRKNEEYSLHLIRTDVRANWLCIKYSR